MTDLQAKFTHLEGLLSAQHEEDVANTDALPVIKIGIDDVNTTASDILAANADFYSSLLTNLSLISVNMTNGLRDVVAAVSSLYCPCDPTLPLIPVPPSTTPTEDSASALCQRIQYFIDLFRTGVLIGESSFVFSAGSLSGQAAQILQSNALAAVDITTGELVTGMPSAVQIGVSSAWSQYIAAIGAPLAQSAVFDVAADLSQWSTIRDALSGVHTATNGYTAFVEALAGTEWSAGVKAIVSAGFYSSWFNDIYSAVPIVDDSEYDGGACSSVPADCRTYTAEPYTGSNGASGWAIVEDIAGGTMYPTIDAPGGTVTFTPAVFGDDNLVDWVVTVLTGTNVKTQTRGCDHTCNQPIPTTDIDGCLKYTATGMWAIYSTDGPFSVRVCPPGLDDCPS